RPIGSCLRLLGFTISLLVPPYLDPVLGCERDCTILLARLRKAPRKPWIEDGWWLGKKNGQLGAFPSNFVELLDSGPPNELALRRGDEVKVLRKIKKLVARKVASRESAPIKEPKKMMPRTALPTVKKLVTAPTGPSRANGDSQKRPSRNSSSSSSFLGGCPGQSGRKRAKTQASQQRSAASRGEERSSLTKAPRVNKTPTLDKTPSLEKTPSPDKAPSPEKTPSPDKAGSPEKTSSLDNARSPEKTLSPDKAPTPEESLTPDKVPILEETPTLEDKAPRPDRVFSVHEAPVPEVPPGPKMAPPGDEAHTLGKVLTTKQVLSEEASTQDNTQFHHFSPEEALLNTRSLEASEAQSQEEVHMPGEHRLCMAKRALDKRDSSPLQSKSKSKSGSMPALEKADPQEEAATLLEEAPAKDEATPKEEVPPEEVSPAQKNPHPIMLTPEPQMTPTLHSLVPQNLTDSKSDRDDMCMRPRVPVPVGLGPSVPVPSRSGCPVRQISRRIRSRSSSRCARSSSSAELFPHICAMQISGYRYLWTRHLGQLLGRGTVKVCKTSR
ncbi:hypothetical protein E2I00_005560, partial [Balaenoptera physalus]